MSVVLLQEYARKALDFIWEKRQRSSNLVGVTINIHTGDWVRKGVCYSESRLGESRWFGARKKCWLFLPLCVYIDFFKMLMGWALGVTQFGSKRNLLN